MSNKIAPIIYTFADAFIKLFIISFIVGFLINAAGC